jgi:hypothetical protein
MYLLVFPATNTALNKFSQFGGCLDWLTSFSIFNNPPSDPSGVSLLAKLKNNPGDFHFREGLQEIRCRLPPSRVHPHI